MYHHVFKYLCDLHKTEMTHRW